MYGVFFSDALNLSGVQQALSSSEAAEPEVRPLGLLLFGDSVDYRIPLQFCNLALHEDTADFVPGGHRFQGLFGLLTSIHLLLHPLL